MINIRKININGAHTFSSVSRKRFLSPILFGTNRTSKGEEVVNHLYFHNLMNAVLVIIPGCDLAVLLCF